jgi:predicted Ser/Thr protein kinase
MGIVFKVRQPQLDRFVALKILAPGRTEAARFAERFQREAQALARLSHPNIVTIHDFGQAGPFYFLLMEFVDGVNLRQLVRARKLQPKEALAIVPPICDALQFAHDRGVVHRDIKPENILLDKDGRVKIADFGIAKMLGSEPATEGMDESQPAGTPHYMAPEQDELPRQADHRADIYSLGVVLYELLTGELPGKPIEPPSTRVHEVRIDVRLDEVVLRALEREPERRYQTAADLKSAVNTISGSGSVSDAARLGDPQPDGRNPSSRLQGRKWAMGAVALLALGILVFAAWLSARPARATVTGRVTDTAGRPVRDVLVRAIPMQFWVPWSDNPKEPKDKREFSAVTDRAGQYRLEGLSAESYRTADTPSYAQQYELVVDTGYFVPQKIRISADRRNLNNADFILQPGVTLAGRAFDTAGKLVTNRNVRLMPEVIPKERDGIRQNLLPPSETIDEGGAFRFEKVTPGIYRLEIAVYPEHGFEVTQSPTNGPLTLPPDDQLVTRSFVFEAADARGGIAGRVIDAASGDLAKAFSLKITSVDSPGEGSPVYGRARVDGTPRPLTSSRSTSWKQGTFLIEDVSQGVATLEFSGEGYARTKAQVQVPSGQTTNIAIFLQPEGVLLGQATRKNQPCAHGYVSLRHVDEPSETGLDAHTDQNGFYEYRGLPAGEYLLRVCVWIKNSPFSAQVTDVARLRVDAGQTTRFNLDFTRSTGIEGSFHAPDRKLQWFVIVEDASPQSNALSPADRRRATVWGLEQTRSYSIDGLTPGTYAVTAKCLRRDEQMTPVAQKSKTVLLKEGEIARLDFKFP